MDTQLLLSKLNGVRQRNKFSWSACCPAHGDKSPSLVVTETGERVLIHCFAGCGSTEILEAVGLDHSVLYPDDDHYRPTSYRPSLEDKLFLQIYRDGIRAGRTPLETDTQRYKKIINQRAR